MCQKSAMVFFIKIAPSFGGYLPLTYPFFQKISKKTQIFFFLPTQIALWGSYKTEIIRKMLGVKQTDEPKFFIRNAGQVIGIFPNFILFYHGRDK